MKERGEKTSILLCGHVPIIDGVRKIMLKDSFIVSTRWLKSFVVKVIFTQGDYFVVVGINLISSEPHLLIIRWINKPVWISQSKLIVLDCTESQQA